MAFQLGEGHYSVKGSVPSLSSGNTLLHYPFGVSAETFLDTNWCRKFNLDKDRLQLQQLFAQPDVHDGGAYVVETQHSDDFNELDRHRFAVSLVDATSGHVPRCLSWKVSDNAEVSDGVCCASFRLSSDAAERGAHDATSWQDNVPHSTVQVCFRNLELEFRSSIRRQLNFSRTNDYKIVVRLLRLGGATELTKSAVLALHSVRTQKHHGDSECSLFDSSSAVTQEVIHHDGHREESVEVLCSEDDCLVAEAHLDAFIKFQEAVHAADAVVDTFCCLTIEVFEQRVMIDSVATGDVHNNRGGSSWDLCGSIRVPCQMKSLLSGICFRDHFGYKEPSDSPSQLLHALAEFCNGSAQTIVDTTENQERSPPLNNTSFDQIVSTILDNVQQGSHTPSSVGNVVVPFSVAIVAAMFDEMSTANSQPLLIWDTSGQVYVAAITSSEWWYPWRQPLARRRATRQRTRNPRGGAQAWLLAIEDGIEQGFIDIVRIAFNTAEPSWQSKSVDGTESLDICVAIDMTTLMLSLGLDSSSVPDPRLPNQLSAKYARDLDLVRLSHSIWVSAVKSLSAKPGHLLSMCQSDLSPGNFENDRSHFPIAIPSLNLLMDMCHFLSDNRIDNNPGRRRSFAGVLRDRTRGIDVVWNQFGEDVAEDSANLVTRIGHQQRIVFARRSQASDWMDFAQYCCYDDVDWESTTDASFPACLAIGGWSAIDPNTDTENGTASEDETTIIPLLFIPVSIRIQQSEEASPRHDARLFTIVGNGEPFPNHLPLAQEASLLEFCLNQEWNAESFLDFVHSNFAEQFSFCCSLVPLPRCGLGGQLAPSVPCGDALLCHETILNDMMSQLIKHSDLGLFSFINSREASHDVVDVDPHSQHFRLSNLDNDQCRALKVWTETVRGSIMVEGPPGSGKSFLEVSFLLNTLLTSKSVLVLSCSEQLAMDTFNSVSRRAPDLAIVLGGQDSLSTLRDRLSQCREVAGSIGANERARVNDEYLGKCTLVLLGFWRW